MIQVCSRWTFAFKYSVRCRARVGPKFWLSLELCGLTRPGPSTMNSQSMDRQMSNMTRRASRPRKMLSKSQTIFQNIHFWEFENWQTWTFRQRVSHTLKCWNYTSLTFETSKLWNFDILKLWNFETLKIWNLKFRQVETLKLLNSRR